MIKLHVLLSCDLLRGMTATALDAAAIDTAHQFVGTGFAGKTAVNT